MPDIRVHKFAGKIDAPNPFWLASGPTTNTGEQVMRAFETMRHDRKPVDLARANAIVFLDAALGADRRQLIKQYVENAEASASTTQRLWQSMQELTQALVARAKSASSSAPRTC